MCEFRGRADGIWYYGNLHICQATGHNHIIWYRGIDGLLGDFTTDINLIENEVIEVDPSTVGKYTGLKDKNGIKIFEDDIVNAIMADGDVLVGYVNWNHKYHCWEFSDNAYSYPLGIWNYAEVVGNIHDNSELLEVQNG